MKINVAINGYGRIGRCVLRALFESDEYRNKIQVVAINETANLDNVIHLTKYDTTHGRFPGDVSCEGDSLTINGSLIRVFSESDPARLPWQEMEVDLVLECTGVYKSRSDAQRHLLAGAKKVLFSHPAESDVDATVVYGVNDHLLLNSDTIVSNASCTTNCVVPVIDSLNRRFSLESAMLTTIHSAMHDQPVIDAYDQDLRKTRSALQSIIPVETGLARGIARILPELTDKITAQAIRVPTINVSMMDMTLQFASVCNKDEVNEALREISLTGEGRIIGFNDDLLVSCDFNHDPRSAIIDANQTDVCNGRMVKVVAWFDNEWGFANRMLDTSIAMMSSVNEVACSA